MIMNYNEVQNTLPHRYPFLLLDGVVSRTEDEIVGLKKVTYNEPHFRGHFPNSPVMPGVLVLEALFQLLWVRHAEEGGFRLRNIKKLRFRRPTLPGDQLDLKATEVSREGETVEYKVEATVEGELAVAGKVWVQVGR